MIRVKKWDIFIMKKVTKKTSLLLKASKYKCMSAYVSQLEDIVMDDRHLKCFHSKDLIFNAF